MLLFFVLKAALPATHGHLVYALDDAYIHMAIAKNLAAHGVYGVTSHEFAAASSSILWPFLLAALYKVFGPVVVIPLICQIVIGIALLWLAWKMLNRAGVTSKRYVCAVLISLVLTIPMVPMTFVAMEHLLHAFLTLLFALVSLDYLYAPSARFLPVLLCAAAVTSVRYEGLFLIAAAALLFLLQKKLIHALAIAAAGAVPIALFGFYSIFHGGFFLPNSLLLKGLPVSIDSLLRLGNIATDCPEVSRLAFAALLLLGFGNIGRATSRALLQLFLLTAMLHQMFAAYGWFYRYEAYLVALGLIAVAVSAWESHAIRTSHRVWALLVLLIMFTPLIERGYKSITATPSAMADIYRQQFQMAEFFRTYYPQGRIAINDIGAISFYGDPYCTDLYGLGSTRITRTRLATLPKAVTAFSLPDNPQVQAVIQQDNVEVAAVYDHYFGVSQGHAPIDWIKVGTWKVPTKTVLGEDEVSFYGIGRENAENLRRNLAEFHSHLPQELSQFAIP